MTSAEDHESIDNGEDDSQEGTDNFTGGRTREEVTDEMKKQVAFLRRKTKTKASSVVEKAIDKNRDMKKSNSPVRTKRTQSVQGVPQINTSGDLLDLAKKGNAAFNLGNKNKKKRK